MIPYISYSSLFILLLHCLKRKSACMDLDVVHVRSLINWGGEQNILYKSVKTSP